MAQHVDLECTASGENVQSGSIGMNSAELMNMKRDVFNRFSGYDRRRHSPANSRLKLMLPYVSILAIIILLMFALKGQMNRPRTDIISSNAAAVVESQTALGLELYQELANCDSSFIFSPYSISFALGVIRLGAAGEAARQLADLLGYQPPPATALNTLLELEERLNWYRHGWRVKLETDYTLQHSAGFELDPAFQRQCLTLPGMKITSAGSFKRATASGPGGSFPGVSLSSSTRFEGKWLLPFKEFQARFAPFFLPSGVSVEVPMMQQQDEFRYCQDDIAQVLELPYCTRSASLILLLPRSRSGLHELEQRLSASMLSSWLDSLKEVEVELFLPRFFLESKLDLREALSRVGFADLFRADADFNLLETDLPQQLMELSQQASIEVDEEGTRAEAETGFWVTVVGIVDGPVVFRADHPFIFLLREERTGLLLFCGRVLDPR